MYADNRTINAADATEICATISITLLLHLQAVLDDDDSLFAFAL
jgi:hypothetical protein